MPARRGEIHRRDSLTAKTATGSARRPAGDAVATESTVSRLAARESTYLSGPA
jgi:hypothetical protein